MSPPHTEDPTRADEPVWLAHATVRSLSELLGHLAEMPSTPVEIADEAEELAADLAEQLPAGAHHWQAGTRLRAEAVAIPGVVATRTAALLDVLSAMPSTPPGVTDDAEMQAAMVWSLLSDPRRGKGSDEETSGRMESSPG